DGSEAASPVNDRQVRRSFSRVRVVRRMQNDADVQPVLLDVLGQGIELRVRQFGKFISGRVNRNPLALQMGAPVETLRGRFLGRRRIYAEFPSAYVFCRTAGWQPRRARPVPHA